MPYSQVDEAERLHLGTVTMTAKGDIVFSEIEAGVITPGEPTAVGDGTCEGGGCTGSDQAATSASAAAAANSNLSYQAKDEIRYAADRQVHHLTLQSRRAAEDGRAQRGDQDHPAQAPLLHPRDYPFKTAVDSADGQRLAAAWSYEQFVRSSVSPGQAHAGDKISLVQSADASLKKADSLFIEQKRNMALFALAVAGLALDLANEALHSSWGPITAEAILGINTAGTPLNPTMHGAAMVMTSASVISTELAAAEVIVPLAVGYTILAQILQDAKVRHDLGAAIAYGQKVIDDARRALNEGDPAASKGADAQIADDLRQASEAAGAVHGAAEVGLTDVTIISSDEANRPHTDKGFAPPYPENSLIVKGEFNGKTGEGELVRFTGPDGKPGQWATPAKDVEGLTPAQIKDKLSLKNEPVKYLTIRPAAGEKARFGEIRGQPSFPGAPKGGGRQVEFESEPATGWSKAKELGNRYDPKR